MCVYTLSHIVVCWNYSTHWRWLMISVPDDTGLWWKAATKVGCCNRCQTDCEERECWNHQGRLEKPNGPASICKYIYLEDVYLTAGLKWKLFLLLSVDVFVLDIASCDKMSKTFQHFDFHLIWWHLRAVEYADSIVLYIQCAAYWSMNLIC